MKTLRLLTVLFALLIGLGEIARWWGNPRFLPLAFDEILVAIAMLAAALFARRRGPAPLVAAWGLYAGLMLSLLVPTLDHLLFGPPKESAVFYAVTLAVMLGIGLLALAKALSLSRAQAREP